MFNWAASPVNNSVHSPNFVSIHFPDSQTGRDSVQSFTPGLDAVPKLSILSCTAKRKEPFKDTCGAGTLLTDINIVFKDKFITK
jgi:hypothetical protein